MGFQQEKCEGALAPEKNDKSLSCCESRQEAQIIGYMVKTLWV